MNSGNLIFNICMSKVHCALPGDAKLKVNAGPTVAPEYAPKDLGQTEPLLCADREPKHPGQRRPSQILAPQACRAWWEWTRALGETSWGLWTLSRPLEVSPPPREGPGSATANRRLDTDRPSSPDVRRAPGDSGNRERQQPLVPVPGGDPEPPPPALFLALTERKDTGSWAFRSSQAELAAAAHSQSQSHLQPSSHMLTPWGEPRQLWGRPYSNPRPPLWAGGQSQRPLMSPGRSQCLRYLIQPFLSITQTHGMVLSALSTVKLREGVLRAAGEDHQEGFLEEGTTTGTWRLVGFGSRQNHRGGQGGGLVRGLKDGQGDRVTGEGPAVGQPGG